MSGTKRTRPPAPIPFRRRPATSLLERLATSPLVWPNGRPGEQFEVTVGDQPPRVRNRAGMEMAVSLAKRYGTTVTVRDRALVSRPLIDLATYRAAKEATR